MKPIILLLFSVLAAQSAVQIHCDMVKARPGDTRQINTIISFKVKPGKRYWVQMNKEPVKLTRVVLRLDSAGQGTITGSIESTNTQGFYRVLEGPIE